MTAASNIWAVIPIKETCLAKQRLAGIFDQNFRRQLALAMLEDTLRAISAVPELEGIIVTTVDMAAADIALQFDAHVWCESASKSHTDAVMAAARRIGADNGTILTGPTLRHHTTHTAAVEWVGGLHNLFLTLVICNPPLSGPPSWYVSFAWND